MAKGEEQILYQHKMRFLDSLEFCLLLKLG
jgi:hypothetical protein